VVDRNNIRVRLGLLDHHGRHYRRDVHTVLDRLLVPSSFSCNIHHLHFLNYELPMVL
jgi:hypothetical protein